MKLTKMTLLICLTVCSTVLTQTCTIVYSKTVPPVKIAESSPAQFYPADLTEEGKVAKENALKQTTAARKFFYSPKDDYLAFIKKAALNLISYYESSPENKKAFIAFINTKEQRQTSDGASAQELFKSAQILAKNDQPVNEMALSLLMTNMKKSPKPSDVLAFLGLCGDFAAATFDVLGGRKETAPNKKLIADIFEKNFKGIGEVIMLKYKLFSPDSYYNDEGKTQSKTKERLFCSNKPDSGVMKLDPRSGVMDTGAQADSALKAGQNALPKISWPWQTADKKLITFCSKEPWAGHFSGSFYELVSILELFGSYEGKPNFDVKWKPTEDVTDKAIAWASAFLIATGMHSSIEVAFPAMKMKKGSLNKIALDNKDLQKTLCEGSTNYTVDLHTKGTKAKRKLK
jgi:hypothetical protein